MCVVGNHTRGSRDPRLRPAFVNVRVAEDDDHLPKGGISLFLLTLQMGKWRPSESRPLAKGHTAGWDQSGD